MNTRAPQDRSTHHRRSPVMVVDDDRLVLLTLAHGLRQAGFEVLEADNGDDAILLARTHRPGLALLDIRMQGLSGFDVAQHLSDYERIPFMFVSAYADEDVRQQTQALGALACLGKPVDMEDLVHRVAQVLDGCSAEPTADAAPPAPGAYREGHAQVTTDTAMALGLLMQRESLDRSAAWQRLQELADSQGGDIELTARLQVAAHEDALPSRATGDVRA